MLLNRIEKAMMNNPVRAAIQRRFEVPRLIEMGGTLDGGHALEVGCGSGVGTEAILARFGAARVDAFDLDPGMVALAEKRLRPHRDRVKLWVGDVTRIDAGDDAYDAVFDFGIVHHVPDWSNAPDSRCCRPKSCGATSPGSSRASPSIAPRTRAARDSLGG
jgi:ubiquinone/menaquinone biosynthesis C-methylase UbiE